MYLHIFLIRKKKENFFEKCLSVRPSVRKSFDPNARRLTKLEPNEIFNDFAISREPIDEIDFLF